MKKLALGVLTASILLFGPSIECEAQDSTTMQRIDPEEARTMLASAATTSYGGVIEFSDRLVGPYGFKNETLRVSVEKGIAFCEGANNTDEGSLTVGGRGLIQIFFQDGYIMKYDSAVDKPAETEADVKKFSKKQFDKVNPLQPVYSFVFACPKPGQVGTTAVWNDSHDSYNQPRPKLAAACARDVACAIKNGLPDMLCGTWNVPNPASDPVNGVAGTLSLTWRLCRGCKPPPRPSYNLNDKEFVFPPPKPCSQGAP